MKKTLTTLAALGIASSVSAATINITTSAETSLRNDGGGPNSTNGGATQMLLGSNVGALNGLVRFDLNALDAFDVGAGITVNSVTLTITNRNQSGVGTVNLILQDYGFDFLENSSSYNDPAGDSSDPTAGGTPGAQFSTITGAGSGANVANVFGSTAALVTDLSGALGGTNIVNYRIIEDGASTDQNFLRVATLEDVGTAAFITVDYDVNAIPEPSSTALISLAGLGFILRRRR